MDYKAIGIRLRKKRKELALTQEKISEYVDISPSFYSHIENGTKKAGLATFVKIASFMKISLDYIIVGDNVPEKADNPYDAQLIYRIQSLSDKEKIFLLGNLKLMEDLRLVECGQAGKEMVQ